MHSVFRRGHSDQSRVSPHRVAKSWPTSSLVGCLAVGLIVAGAGPASAQTFPEKPIRLIASEAGGANDRVAQVVAQGLTTRLGQQVTVDNAPGGSDGAEAALKSAADGYTVINVGTQFWVEPLLHKTPYEVSKDFVPVILLTNVPFNLYVNTAVPVNSVAELIAFAKARPGELKYASGGTGSSNHLATELLKAMAGIDLTRVVYDGGRAAVRGAAANETQIVIGSAGAAAESVKEGKLKALATTNAQRSELAPDVPAIAETLPGYQTVQGYGILAPAGTPQAIVRQLNHEIAEVMNAPEVKATFLKSGTEVVAGSSEEFAAFIESETAKWTKLIRDAGIRAD